MLRKKTQMCVVSDAAKPVFSYHVGELTEKKSLSSSNLDLTAPAASILNAVARSFCCDTPFP